MNDLNTYLRDLRRRGYVVQVTHRNHWLILDGETIVAGSAATPSDYRGLLNLRAAIRRWERLKKDAALARSPSTGRVRPCAGCSFGCYKSCRRNGRILTRRKGIVMAQYALPCGKEYLTATAAQAYIGIDHRKIERELMPDATLRSNGGKIYALWLTASVNRYAAANEDAQVKRAARMAKVAAG